MYILLNIPTVFWYNGVMRTLCTFGFLALFIGSAFITPSQANVVARAEQARAQVQTTVRGALVKGSTVDPASALRASALLTRALQNESASKAVSSALRQHASASEVKGALSTSLDALSLALPTPKKVVSHVVRSVVRTPVVTSKQWKSLLASKNSPALKRALEDIDFAARKHDPRFCRSLDPSLVDRSNFSAPTVGDLLALCLAKVSADPDRCSTIDPETGAVLRTICEAELVHAT